MSRENAIFGTPSHVASRISDREILQFSRMSQASCRKSPILVLECNVGHCHRGRRIRHDFRSALLRRQVHRKASIRSFQRMFLRRPLPKPIHSRSDAKLSHVFVLFRVGFDDVLGPHADPQFVFFEFSYGFQSRTVSVIHPAEPRVRVGKWKSELERVGCFVCQAADKKRLMDS